MRIRKLFLLSGLVILITFSATACRGRGDDTPTPTPTTAPEPPPSPTPVPPTPDTEEAEGEYLDVALLTDATIVSPGKSFVVTWRIRNTGTETWAANAYRWVFTRGDQMEGPSQVPIASTVPGGAEYEVTVTLVAPEELGSYEGRWQLYDAEGELVGPGIVVRVDVQAEEEEAASGEPPDEEPTEEEPTEEEGEICLDAYPVSDVTVPDGTIMEPGEIFTKVWRIRNTGTCEWSQDQGGFMWTFVSGNQMGGPDQVPIPLPVPPGGDVDVEVVLIAPTEPGQYRGNWKVQGPDGETFGAIFWVEIQVGGEETEEPVSDELAALALQIWQHINGRRSELELPQFAYSEVLAQAAQIQANDCSQRSEPCSHIGSDGSTPAERAERVGYTGCNVEEAWANTASPWDAVALWLDESPDNPYRRLLLSTVATEVGVGVAPAEDGYFFVVLFGQVR